MRKTFLTRLLKKKRHKTEGGDETTMMSNNTKKRYAPPVLPECRKPVMLRTAILSWEPHVVGSNSKVRGVKFTGCVQPRSSSESCILGSDGYKATFDGEAYHFAPNEDPLNFTHKVGIGSLLTFTVWGMLPSDAADLKYGHVITVDGVNCTQKGSRVYFNATLVVEVEPDTVKFVDYLPALRYDMPSDCLSKIQLKPYYIQGCDHATENMPPYHFEDVVMKVKADQPQFLPYLEFRVTLVEGDKRMALGMIVRPSLCAEYFRHVGLRHCMEKVVPCPQSWGFTLVGHLNVFWTGHMHQIFVTDGFFFES